MFVVYDTSNIPAIVYACVINSPAIVYACLINSPVIAHACVIACYCVCVCVIAELKMYSYVQNRYISVDNKMAI